MVKKDFIERISRKTGLNKSVVRLVVEKFLKEIKESFLRGERIEIRNFGVFYVKTQKPKKGRNLKTGESVNIPEREKIMFKPSKIFKFKEEK